MQNQPSNEALSVRSDAETVVASSPSSVRGHFDPLADLVVNRWWQAVRWSQSELIENYSIEQTLAMCDRQRRGVYEDSDRELLDGIDIFIPLTNMKCMAGEAWLRDMLASVIQMPWLAEPTPLPELPARLKAKALRDLKFEIVAAATRGNPIAGAQALAQMPPRLADLAFGQMISTYPGDLEEAARKLKETSRQLAMAEAKKAAQNMNRLMRDQCVELGMGSLNHQLFYDLVTFPIAVVKGPILTSRPRIVWSGNRQVVRSTGEVDAYRVSPFDLKPSPDSPDTQRGTYVCERITMTKRDLRRARQQKYWITSAIDNLLGEYADRSRNWLLENTSYNPEIATPLGIWTDDESIVAVEHHGICSGEELRPYGFALDDDTYYETRAVVSGYRTLMVKISGEAFVTPRPYHATSYERRGERFYGTCPNMKLRDVQRSVNAAFRAKIRNMAFSCLTGDTVVYRHETPKANGKPRRWRDRHLTEVTLNELWAARKAGKANLTRQRLRSLNEESGAFFGNKVLDIIDNGVRPVYRVSTAAGYAIKATMNHRFLGDDGGYRELQRLAAGDMIAVNGAALPRTKACADCGIPVTAKAMRCESCANRRWNSLQATRALDNRQAQACTARARTLVRAQMKAACEKCGVQQRLHLHHVDRDPHNCRPENLMTLCEPCHKAWHVRHNNYGDPFKHAFLDFDRITSIEYVGEEQVFDLAMEGPNHNFVANGFVSHNSGPQVEADLNRLKGYVARIEDLLNLSPYSVKFADPDLVNGGRPAYTYTNVPQIIAPLLNLVKYYMTLADDVSNIPNYAQGDPALSGAGRTFRGFSAVFAQALKVFKVPVQNLDDGIYSPFATMLYNHNVAYSDDPGVKGDCRVNARGSQGLVDKETEEQRALDRMGVIAQIVPALTQADPEAAKRVTKVLEWTAAKAMEGLGVPIRSFGFDPDVQAALGEEQEDFEPTQEPIPSIGKTVSPG